MRNKWIATLQREDGEIVEYPISTGWEPTREGIPELVAKSAAAEAWWASDKKFKFAGISAALVED